MIKLKAKRQLSWEQGQILPLVAATVVLSLLVLLAVFTFYHTLEIRTQNQTLADLAALAGANKLSQGVQAQRSIAFIIWSRNTVLDGLYLAAAILSVSSGGLATELFTIPRTFQSITAPVIEKLETADEAVAKMAVVASVKEGMAVGKNNGLNGSSYAVPIPLFSTSSGKSQKQLDLERLIKMYSERIAQAQAELEVVSTAYYQVKAQLEADPNNESLKKEFDRLSKELKEKAGRLGGLTRWKNQREKELAELKTKETFLAGGQDGVIGFVWRQNANLSASSLIGAVNSGANVSMAAAKVVDSQTNQVVGEQAFRNLAAKIPGLQTTSQGFIYVLKALSLFSERTNDFLSQFGLLSSSLGRFLKSILPPNIKAAKPALAPVQDVLKDESRLSDYLKAAAGVVK